MRKLAGAIGRVGDAEKGRVCDHGVGLGKCVIELRCAETHYCCVRTRGARDSQNGGREGRQGAGPGSGKRSVQLRRC